jgi:hypothetical protein
MCVCVYSVFVFSCVYVEALRRADHSSKEFYLLCKNDYGTEYEARDLNGLEEPLKKKKCSIYPTTDPNPIYSH